MKLHQSHSFALWTIKSLRKTRLDVCSINQVSTFKKVDSVQQNQFGDLHKSTRYKSDVSSVGYRQILEGRLLCGADRCSVS